jgi:hypothetical protein
MRTGFTLAAASLLLVACDVPTGPATTAFGEAAYGAAAGGDQAAVDISGTWQQQRELFIHLADWAAPMFGIQAEGKRTTLRCVLTGTVDITQDGDTFVATTSQVGECSTPGGQVTPYGGPGGMEGTIQGRNVHAVAIGQPGPVECLHRGSVRVVGGVAVEISGMAQCIEPGHPRSLVQVPLPRSGPNHTNWTMTR